MRMDARVLSRVQERLFAVRIREEAELAERRAEIYERVPRVAEIDAELGSTAARIMRAAVDGEDPTKKLAALRAKNVDMQLERAALLDKAGYAQDALELRHECADCGDTGYLKDGRACRCLIRMYAEEQLSELESRLPVRKASFESFDELVYPDGAFENWKVSPRKNALAVRDFCRELAIAEQPERSIYLYGGAGVGKTFLAAATAVEASKRGKSVLCASFSELVSLYSKERFTYDDDIRDAAGDEIARLNGCDLLIIDNLGTEFRSTFSSSALLGVLSARMGAGRATLICSCVGKSELESRYSPQAASRLLGDEFFALPLYGPDLRRAGA